VVRLVLRLCRYFELRAQTGIKRTVEARSFVLFNQSLNYMLQSQVIG
jgi:hypothetical protein